NGNHPYVIFPHQLAGGWIDRNNVINQFREIRMSKKRRALPVPTVPPCMLFCDSVIVDQASGKTTLVGTFSGVAASTFPSPPKDIHIYSQVTSFVGEVEFRLVCVQIDLPESTRCFRPRIRCGFVVNCTWSNCTWFCISFNFPDRENMLFNCGVA